MNAGLSIGELAAETATPISPLRFYERKGLLPPPPRVSGQRRYPRGAADRIRMIHMWQHAGFSLGEVARLLDNRRRPEAWQQLVRSKISELERLRSEVERSRQQLEHALLCQAPDWTTCAWMQATASAYAPARRHEPQ